VENSAIELVFFELDIVLVIVTTTSNSRYLFAAQWTQITSQSIRKPNKLVVVGKVMYVCACVCVGDLNFQVRTPVPATIGTL
jgi:hypothetical protein